MHGLAVVGAGFVGQARSGHEAACRLGMRERRQQPPLGCEPIDGVVIERVVRCARRRNFTQRLLLAQGGLRQIVNRIAAAQQAKPVALDRGDTSIPGTGPQLN